MTESAVLVDQCSHLKCLLCMKKFYDPLPCKICSSKANAAKVAVRFEGGSDLLQVEEIRLRRGINTYLSQPISDFEPMPKSEKYLSRMLDWEFTCDYFSQVRYFKQEIRGTYMDG